MEMRLIRESIQMEQLTAQAESQAVVEGDMTLPGGLREETHVLHAGGMAVVEGAEAMQDRASISGKVHFYALYTQGDPDKVNALEATADFTHMMDMPGVQPRSRCRAWAQVEHVEARVSGGRLTMKAVIRLQGRAVTPYSAETVTGLEGVTGLEAATRPMTIRRTVAQGAGETLLREEVALPEGLNIRDTLCATATASITDVTGGLGRIGLAGQVNLEVVHASAMPGKPIVITRHTLSFDDAVALTGEDGEELSGRVTVRDVAVVSQEGEQHERTLRTEILLGIEGWADRQEQLTILDDAYTTTGDALNLTAQTVACRTQDSFVQTAESGKAMLILPEGSPAVRGLLCGFALPTLTGKERVGGRLNVEGVMEVTLLYMTDDSTAPVSVRMEQPFRATFAAQTGPDDLIALTLTDVDVSALTSDRVEMKYILHMQSSGAGTEEARLVTDVTGTPAEEVPGGIVLYFTQPGETLWDIARRYRVPVKDVQALNPGLKGDPAVGQGVVIWHKASAI
ncbi:MAG: SPOCS domain-containing protein [Aristaeellaceae bacterium]